MTVRVGMLGCGFIGEFHALGLRYVRDAQIVASCDASPERRDAYATRFGGRAYATVDEVCADPEVDLVIVSLPNHLHRDAVLAAVAAGKAVACTKPLGRNAGESADMLRAVRDAGVFNAYLENVIFNPDLLRMRDMVEAGSIGRLTTVRAREGHSGPHAAHFWDAELAGGGALLDMASHGAEYARFLFGKDLEVTDVFAWGATLVHGERTQRRGQRRHGHALRRWTCGDGRRLVVVEGRPRGPVRGIRRWRAADHRYQRRVAQGVRGAAVGLRGGEGGRRDRLDLPGSDEVRVHGHDLMMADVIGAFAAGRAPQETFRDGYASTGSWTPPTGPCGPGAGSPSPWTSR